MRIRMLRTKGIPFGSTQEPRLEGQEYTVTEAEGKELLAIGLAVLVETAKAVKEAAEVIIPPPVPPAEVKLPAVHHEATLPKHRKRKSDEE